MIPKLLSAMLQTEISLSNKYDVNAFMCIAKSFATAFLLIFFSFFLYCVFEQTGKSFSKFFLLLFNIFLFFLIFTAIYL